MPWYSLFPQAAQSQQDEQAAKSQDAHTSGTSTEELTDEDTQVSVMQQEGFMCKIRLRAKVNMKPHGVYELLVAEDNRKWFKSIKEVRSRKVLEDNGHGKQRIEIEQVGQWRFLAFRGEINTKLYVDQDANKRTVDFYLREPGFMKEFEGHWQVQPYTQQTLKSARSTDLAERQGSGSSTQQHQQGQQQDQHQGSWSLPRWPFQQEETANVSLVTLEQSVLPSFNPPPPFDRLVKGITAKQVQKIMQDLNAEVERRNKAARNT